jgi:hypothetical protein
LEVVEDFYSDGRTNRALPRILRRKRTKRGHEANVFGDFILVGVELRRALRALERLRYFATLRE